MSDINATVILGRLVRDPMLKNNGTPMGYFTLASNQRYRDKAGVMQTETAYVACKVFGAWTDALANRKKGDTLVVAGRLRTETWQKDGESQSQLVLVCDSVHPVTVSAKTSTEPDDKQPNGFAEPLTNNQKPPF